MYPDRNPFPPQATVSLDAMVAYQVDDFPTATSRVPLQRLMAIQRRYLEDPPATGRAVALHGRHGTGKTHTVLYALSSASKAKPSAKPPVVLYVRADGPDSLVLYRKLMSRWTASELTELAEQAFAGYAADEFVASRDAVTGETDDTRKLRDDPQLAIRAMRENELSFTSVVDRLEDDIRRIQGRYGNFERVLRALVANPALRPAAHRWLLADTVDADELKRLGVAGRIEQLAEIRIGIHMLALLARRAGRPLTLAMDQIEAFARTSDGTIDSANAGLLRGLVEDLVEEKGFFIAAVGEDVWRRLPPDLHQRFGPAEIQMPELSLNEAEDVLSAYLAPWSSKANQAPAFPFLPDAVRQLLVESGGNIRRFLQASYVTFECWRPSSTGIEEGAVKHALATAGGDRAPDEEAVRRTVERTLRATEWNVLNDVDVDGQLIDFAVLSGQRIVLAVKISQAVFGKDEAIKAVRQIEALEALRRDRPAVVFVVVGYSSPDVREKLQKAGRLVVANGTDFAAEVAEVLREAVPENDPPPLAVLDERLDHLRDELVTLIERRDAEEQIVSTRLEKSQSEHSHIEWNEQLRRFRSLWLQESQKIEDAIVDHRSKQRRDEVSEIVTMHDDYRLMHLARRGRMLRFILTAATLLLATLLGVIVDLNSFYLSSGFVTLAPVAILFAGGAVVYVTYTRQSASPKVDPNRIENIEDLNRTVRQVSHSNLISADPFNRYAAILERKHHHQYSPKGLYSLALREPSALIRRILLSSAIAGEPELLLRSRDSSLQSADLSGGVEAITDVEYVWDDLPGVLRLVALLRRQLPDQDDWSRRETPQAGSRPNLKLRSWLERFVADVTAPPSDYVPPMPIADAFRTDEDWRLAEALQSVSERELRRAAAVFSPLDPEGLGSHYWLDSSELIQDMYLFFRKALFFLAGGVERDVVAKQ
ncbi:MAG TPA: hypothetical protein VJU82_15045 [Acidobacteriaceae bacterium]|nr:hypothetical protein [Acidobacteriaceae bacterium]